MTPDWTCPSVVRRGGSCSFTSADGRKNGTNRNDGRAGLRQGEERGREGEKRGRERGGEEGSNYPTW